MKAIDRESGIFYSGVEGQNPKLMETTLSYHRRLFLLLLSVVFVWAVVGTHRIEHALADTVSTSVTVGNSAPSVTGAPAETVASSATSPTNAGTSINVTATAADSNNESYYLIICSTNAVNDVNGGPPTCVATQYCISSLTSSNSQATCTITTTDGSAETNAWWAFVCDNNSGNAECSTGQQGSGDSGTPFIVNHRPSFSAVTDPASFNPGGTVTWTATASDSDTAGSADTTTLVVCKTQGITGNDCDGGASDRWCTATGASNPACSYEATAPEPDGTYAAYTYVVDSHNFAATGAPHDTDKDFVINNVAPTVLNATITGNFNGNTEIELSEGGTVNNVTVSSQVTDNNSCGGGEISGVVTNFYRSGVGATGCDTAPESDNSYCYYNVSCVASNCSGTDDTTADYTCTLTLQHYADPTDTSTQYPSENWMATMVANDNNSATGSDETNTGMEVLSLTALSVTSSIGYGSLSAGTTPSNLTATTTTTATGNVGIDEEVSGTQMCTDYPTCSQNTIALNNQKYALSSVVWASGIVLTGSASEIELNVAKPTQATPSPTGTTYWGLAIPGGTTSGTYTGQNTVNAVKGETINW